jgi:hypothetical protein
MMGEGWRIDFRESDILFCVRPLCSDSTIGAAIYPPLICIGEAREKKKSAKYPY